MHVPKRIDSLLKSRPFRIGGLFFLTGLLALMLVPIPGYSPQFSTALYCKDGHLLSAISSREQQWCFPMEGPVPEKFKQCLLLYEDEWFYYHPGFNPVSIFRAWHQNRKTGKISRGASTLTMQLMRMKNPGSVRNYKSKIRESLAAVKYTILYKKSTVLRQWAETAPFGGNTIGLRAASLRYFAKDPDDLTYAQYALLAVMPNTPSSATLNINRDRLIKNRNFLLVKLHKNGYIDAGELELYLDEDIPEVLTDIPQNSYHALSFFKKQHPDQYLFFSTLDSRAQQLINELVQVENTRLKNDGIMHAAVVVVDVVANQLMAYTGNVKTDKAKFNYVDIVQAPRSYGSLLKPFLYAECMARGLYLPREMVQDVPTNIADFRPKNFDRSFRGAARMDEMLIQSLNVPSVRVLNELGLAVFYEAISKFKIRGLDKGYGHYGLSLILGGGETSLWEMSRLYKGLARNYLAEDYPFEAIQYLQNQTPSQNITYRYPAASIGHTVHYMADIVRPREEKHWEVMNPSNKISWKTGTSYGHRDAWAIGFNSRFMVAVWVGNENGDGRYNLTGVSKAAPLMFKCFSALGNNAFFQSPPMAEKPLYVHACKESGKLAGPLCKHTEELMVDIYSHSYRTCNYHSRVFLNAAGQSVPPFCEAEEIASIDTCFHLPPFMEYYYRKINSKYKGLPPNSPLCGTGEKKLKIIYPEPGMKIFLPKDAPDIQNQLVAKAYHNDVGGRLYWFLNQEALCVTYASEGHECSSYIRPGKHTLSITDEYGNREEVVFEVL
jgi:penicillin-binding protein 1C